MLLATAGVARAVVRVPNTTLTLPATPPQSGFVPTLAFGNLAFTDPLAIVSPPDETNRLFIVEQRGVVAVITNLAAPNRSEFLNLTGRVLGGAPSDEQGLLGLAFHPGFRTNGFFYVYFTTTEITTNLDGSVNNGPHQCLARFRASVANTNIADPGSELRLLSLFDEAPNHNGGCLQFGPDAYLYVSTGDEGGQDDSFNNSQRIDKDFWSGLLRLDVDLRPGSLVPTPHPAHRIAGWNGVINYRVPPDNPFVGATSFNGVAINPGALRSEFWAVGLRNPWRFTFDTAGGALYCADVGGSLWEEVDVITRGGNYGWACREGNIPGPKAAQAPPGFISVPPILAYSHGSATNQGFAITGGVVYRGSRFPSLDGRYVFADYVSGHIWAALPNGTNAVGFQYLTTDAGIAGFGVDPRNGDVLLADQTEDRIKRLVTVTNLTGPATLADTGAFASLASLTPNAGILPYEINLSFWSDNAKKTRWFSIPNTNLTMTFSAEGNWLFPTGTVWIKHFDLETNTLTHETRRMETRFLVSNTNGVYGLTYVWSHPPTNAVLAPEEGLDESIVINDGGTLRTQAWHYPGRGECLSCHSIAGGGPLGFDTFQLHRNVQDGALTVNQIKMLSDAGYLSTSVSNVNTLRALAHPTNESASLEWRVRSYLEANCSFCHQPAGTIGSWDGRLSTPTAQANLINGTLARDGGGGNRVIAPGDPAHSMILTRLGTRGPGGMPPVGSNLADTNGAALLHRWITTDLTNYQSFADWQVAWFGSTNAPAAAPGADLDGDGANNQLEYLTRTSPAQRADFWSFRVDPDLPGFARLTYLQPSNRAVELQWNKVLLNISPWRRMDVPTNQPSYPATNHLVQWAFPVAGNPKLFFRVRISAP